MRKFYNKTNQFWLQNVHKVYCQFIYIGHWYYNPDFTTTLKRFVYDRS